ncbi:phosphoribosyl AMP cyclohydrolase [Gluconobacter thailandicus F149-1 = NBRC 100600]|uniref:Phosphoribosyl-AMP cyclohydrolase n=1 Tax=Gluconobacter thailandicus NBRC 3257 TaxID=1381097 RepID=A0ABQ0IYY7_GLUTH|nr:phosphoribosyl-AMP cyclohydrolase [Gluconobacter thailandicus]GAN90004.1 phosphoribosyl AMP cyclohydrolase [Gluconobacter frateurii M-2]KXV53075.1 phosphoribosyl-AMP cyclohydrolase [Gluconobacter thailandicus]GAC87061.1 phosphoribosyl AMP cyclohydrolase [Gluconobacter thailandicus NBRC 3255]GAD27418.1 phosphoribosyl AMP cyclohydrolase [Gluconobacter thailandicus NBRC 3257]GAN93699.1 phosphoribosyl AMP cyclohydrolase [Gluconobacter thailandicus F149-1 = NBRC 100600]
MTYTPPAPAIIDDIVSQTKFDANGLISAIAQDTNGVILMLAWMNADALRETLLTGRVCYWSRSRKSLWRKGETSGQQQHLLEARLDCDMDAVLMIVDQTGVACHTGRRSCFYHGVTPDGLRDTAQPEISAEELYGR